MWLTLALLDTLTFLNCSSVLEEVIK
jgi:hypothetical protein